MLKTVSLHHSDHWPENLFVEAMHVLGHIGIDVWPHVYPSPASPRKFVGLFSFSNQPLLPRVLLPRQIHTSLDPTEEIFGVFLREHRPIQNVIVPKRISNPGLLDLGHELVHELIIDIFVDDQVP